MRNAFFPHMEWAKAHSKNPLPIELGFSGAAAPRGERFREYGRGHPGVLRLVARRYGIAQSRVYLAGGTSLANFIAIAAFCDAGETVAVETPRYAPLAEIPRSLGAEVIDVPRDRLERLPRGARLLLVTTPHNPTGRLLTAADWKSLARFADRGGIVVVDEVYRDLQQKPPRVAALRHPRFLTTGGLTKTYGLGALRLGWVLGDPELLEPVRRVDNLVSVECATPSFLLAERVWPRLDALRARTMRPIAKNLATLRATGLSFIEPEAGLTAFVRVGDGDAVCDAMEKRGVGLARGSFFGAPEYVRLFLGAPNAPFREGVRRLADYLAN